MLAEYYNYVHYRKRSKVLLYGLLTFYSVLYFLLIIGLYASNKHNVLIFWVLFVGALLPLFANQALVLLFLLIYLPLFFSQQWQTTDKYIYSPRLLVVLLILFTIIYILSSYFVMTFSLYFLGNTTYFDLFHPELYTHPFLETRDIESFFMFKDQQLFDKKVETGRLNISSKTIIFGILMRNVSFNFEALKKRLEGLGQYFLDYRVIVFENDSTDCTRELITQWQGQNKKIILLDCCHYDACNCRLSIKNLHHFGMRSAKRTEKMRLYRQEILNHVHAHFQNFDYYCILDSDIPGGLYLPGFLSTFSGDMDWDAVFARGLTTLPFSTKLYLYDGYAFISGDHDFEYSTGNYDELHVQNKHLDTKNIIDADWIRSKSGFNGMAIFKIPSLYACNYYNDVQYKCEHIDLYYSMHKHQFDKIYFNPALIIFAGHQGQDRIKEIFASPKK